jgi:hypothetical protein
MSILRWLSISRCMGCLGSVVLMGFGIASAQRASTVSSGEPVSSIPESHSFNFSSSSDWGFSDANSADSSAAAAGGGQYDTRSGGGLRPSWVMGGGFNAPIGNDSPYISWGGNFTGGGGLRLLRGLSVLGEFSFFANRLPKAFVASGGGQTGNTHIFAVTVDPVFNLFSRGTNSVYVVGGGGFYHKSTNFNDLEGYDFYGSPVYVTANSFSSNQGGFNGGFGLTHRLGGGYGDGTMKLFAEARYTWIATPKVGEPNGLGRTEIIPVTFGLRW